MPPGLARRDNHDMGICCAEMELACPAAVISIRFICVICHKTMGYEMERRPSVADRRIEEHTILSLLHFFGKIFDLLLPPLLYVILIISLSTLHNTYAG